LVLEVRDPAMHEDEVNRPLADHLIRDMDVLIRDMDVAALRVSRLRLHRDVSLAPN